MCVNVCMCVCQWDRRRVGGREGGSLCVHVCATLSCDRVLFCLFKCLIYHETFQSI